MYQCIPLKRTIRTCIASLSTSEYIATVLTPSFFAVRITLHAISPLITRDMLKAHARERARKDSPIGYENLREQRLRLGRCRGCYRCNLVGPMPILDLLRLKHTYGGE